MLNNTKYSNYSFFDKENKPTETEPIIEGIANFCALNRSQSGKNNSGWNRLRDALNDGDDFIRNQDSADSVNDNLKQFSKKIGDVITSSGNQVEYGNVFVFTQNYGEYINNIPVTDGGMFAVVKNIIEKSPDTYSFAYEDKENKLRRVVINDGFNAPKNKEGVETYNKIFQLVITDEDVSGLIFGSDSGSTRGTDGKLENTERRNSGAERRYNGMKIIYADTLASTVNLCLGIVFASIFIAKSQ